MSLSEFPINDVFTHMNFYDVEKLKALPTDVFKRHYDEDMARYFANHGRQPWCERCEQGITSPEQLRRMFGMNYHPHCFLEQFEEKRDGMDAYEKGFFGLVASISGRKSI